MSIEVENPSQPTWKEVVIEEYFSKDDGVVYWHWRFGGDNEWRKEKTAYNEIPVVRVNHGA